MCSSLVFPKENITNSFKPSLDVMDGSFFIILVGSWLSIV